MENTTSKIAAKPVTIISGFLGAGKTSFLNELIGTRKKSRPAIIENELGEEGIDGGLIVAPEGDIFELNSGCLCCSLNDDLIDLLGEMLERRDEFEELIIETTGIADPAGVAQPFLAIPEIARYFKLERVICIVDAQLIGMQLEHTSEARKQIAFADIILINKCDTADKAYLLMVKEILQNINPFARVFSGSRMSGYPIEKIMEINRSDFDNKLPEMEEKHHDTVTVRTEKHIHHHKHEEHHHHDKEHHHHDISSMSFVFDRPFNLDLFEHRLLIFLNFQAQDIYRVKGFIHVAGDNQKKVVQSVSNLLAITPGTEWPIDEERKSRIVFIGKNLQSKGLRNMLAQCLDKSYIHKGT